MQNASNTKVLYVEDEDSIRIVAAEALREAGFEVLEAKTADDAVLLLADPNDVKALVTDVRLPGTMDGVDLAHETRKVFPQMPVLIASGYAEHITERLQALDPPALFMAKPFALHKLVTKMKVLTCGV